MADAVGMEFARRLNEISRRVREVELRMDRIENSFGNLEENVLAHFQDLKLSLEKIGNRLSDILKKVEESSMEIDKLKKFSEKAATKSELKQVETFISLINPITSKFVTKEELEREIQSLSSKQTKKLKA